MSLISSSRPDRRSGAKLPSFFLSLSFHLLFLGYFRFRPSTMKKNRRPEHYPNPTRRTDGAAPYRDRPIGGRPDELAREDTAAAAISTRLERRWSSVRNGGCPSHYVSISIHVARPGSRHGAAPPPSIGIQGSQTGSERARVLGSKNVFVGSVDPSQIHGKRVTQLLHPFKYRNQYQYRIRLSGAARFPIMPPAAPQGGGGRGRRARSRERSERR